MSPNRWVRPAIVPQRRRRRHLQNGAAPAPGLRVVFETSTLSDDERSCTSAGQSVLIGDEPRADVACGDGVADNCNFSCSAEHILDSAKRAALLRLLPAVAAWLRVALLSLEPVSGPLAVASEPPCGFGGRVRIPSLLLEQGSADTDVLVLVTARPTAGSALASGTADARRAQ